MEQIRLKMTAMANGGAALGRDEQDRVVFVPRTIPGEEVLVEITADKKRYRRGQVLEILQPSDRRQPARCPHFELCGGCHFQHISYPAQLQIKGDVIRDQLGRIAGLEQVLVRPCLVNPTPWEYANEVSLSPVGEEGLGFWSPELGRVMAIETCHVIDSVLLELMEDVDLLLPGLRKLTLRIGFDGSLLAALEVEDVEPPQLETDFPISVALVLPDGTAANLVGDNYLVQQVHARPFRVSAGSYFYPSLAMTESLVDVVLDYAALQGDETVLEAYSGVGTLTAFLAAKAAEIVAIELNADSVDDAAVNLDAFDNVSLFQGDIEEILPHLELAPQVMVVDPPAGGLPPEIIDEVKRLSPQRLVYVSEDVATLARDGRRLQAAGYQLQEVQPLDMQPQNYRVICVALWQKKQN